MRASVTEQLWIDFDLDTAVFLDTISYWIKQNASNKQPRNFKDGRYWTYNTQEALAKMFPGWKRESIRRIIRNCVKNGLLIVGNYNKKGYDRTGWYSLTDKSIQYYTGLSVIMQLKPDNPIPDSCGDSNQACVGSNQAIPKLLPTVSNINITNSEFNNSHSSDNLANEQKADYLDDDEELNLHSQKGLNGSAVVDKSDYHNNQQTKRTVLTKKDHNSGIKENNSCSEQKARSKKAVNTNDELMAYIDVYREIFPNNPQPHKRVIATSLQKTLRTLIKRWPELDPNGKTLSVDAFRRYLQMLKLNAPKFSLGEYITQEGNRKKNNLETFARWNTVVKFLENAYS
jgi:hypothetical protein